MSVQHIAPVMWPFTVALMAMVLFLLDWCLQGFIKLRRNYRLGYQTAFSTESEARGIALLKHWLSPSQLRSYLALGYFDVVGSDSTIVYRIHHGTEANVEQLDTSGHSVCAWCVVPEGDLVAGDVMLAQKIALETDVRAALGVAIRYATLRNRSTARMFALFGALR